MDAPVRTLIADVPEPNGHPESTDLQVIRTIRDNKRTHTSASLSHKEKLSLLKRGRKTPGDKRLPQQTSGDYAGFNVLDQLELME